MNKTAYAVSAAVFDWVEYSVFSTMLILSILIGIYFGWVKKQDTVSDYMLGGKKMGVLPVAVSLVASHTSGVSLLGIPAEIYMYGTQYCAIFFCNLAILFIINYLFLPVFYPLQLNSLYEYLELRFSKGTRTLASFIFAIALIIFIPVVIYVPALAFNQVTGVSIHVISPIISVICIFYTSFGGLKAVLWTDTLQSIFTLISTISIVFIGFYKIGSVSEVWRINDEGGRLEFWNMNPDPFERNSFWAMSIGSIFTWLNQLAVHPGAIQRFIAVPTFRHAKLVMFWSFIGFIVIKGLVIVVGMLLYAFYYNCDPIATKMVKRSGQIVPFYVMSVAKDFPGLTGLFISGVMSAALSTMSAGLNTAAGTLYEDFVQFILKGKTQSDAKQSFTLKLIVIILGVICTALVFVVERLGAIFQMAISLLGVTSGALVGLFCLGLFFPRANTKGAISGAITSTISMAVIIFGAQYYTTHGLLKFPSKHTRVDGCPANLTHSLGFNASANVQTYVGLGSPVVADDSVPLIFQISYLYYCTVGTLIVFLVGLPVSYLTEQPDISTQDPKLFSPIVRGLLPRKQNFDNTPPAEEYKLVSTNPNILDLMIPEESDVKKVTAA